MLCIGDAAHAMSPIGGVGVNLAIQDAVAAANALIPPLRQHRLQLKHLLSVQRRREFPTRAIQFLQIKMSQRKPGERRAAGGSRLIARVGNSRWLPRLFGRIIGLVFVVKRRDILKINSLYSSVPASMRFIHVHRPSGIAGRFNAGARYRHPHLSRALR